MTTLDKYLAEVRERAEKATPGPWWSDFDRPMNGDGFGWFVCQSIDRDWRASLILYGGNSDKGRYDSDFIAHSREDIPRLVAMVEELKRQRDKYRDAFIVHAKISHQRADEMEAKDNAKLERLSGEGGT